jgi:hypothetical protein
MEEIIAQSHRGVVVQLPEGVKDFFFLLHNNQTGFGATQLFTTSNDSSPYEIRCSHTVVLRLGCSELTPYSLVDWPTNVSKDHVVFILKMEPTGTSETQVGLSFYNITR